MLQSIRDRTSGLIAGFVVALIVIPFAFWGVESFVSGGGDPVVIKVGDQKIHQSEFRRAYQQYYQQYLQEMGDTFRADQFDQAHFQQLVLDKLTQDSQLRQFTRGAGYRAGDAVLFDVLSGNPAFQTGGKFNPDAYKAALSGKGLTAQRYESQLRDSLEIDQMREAVAQTAFNVPVEARQLMQLAGQQRDVSYVLLALDHYSKQVSVSDAELQQRYDDTKGQYLAPERIKLAYVELSAESLPEPAAPDQATLQQLYDTEKAGRFSTQEERKLSDIQINFGTDKAAAQKKADALVAQLKGGASFAALAAANSDDVVSKKIGGALGWFKRGQMPDDNLEKALWELKAGETSAPVANNTSWHLLHVDEIKPASIKPFSDSEVQSELLDLYRNRQRQQQFQALSEKLEQLAFENPASLDAVAKQLNLQVQNSDWLTRTGGVGIGSVAAVQQAAFAPEVLKDGENSKPLVVDDSKLVVIRKADYEAPRQKKLEEVAEPLRNALRDEKAKAQALADAKALLEAARKGQSLNTLAAAKGLDFKSLGPIRRDNSSEDKAIIEALFKLPHPNGDTPSYGQALLANGNVAVIALTRVGVPDVEVSAGQQRQLQQLNAAMEFEAYRKQIGDKVKVKIVNPPVADTAPTPDS